MRDTIVERVRVVGQRRIEQRPSSTFGPCTIRDSVALAAGPKSVALIYAGGPEAPPLIARNLTAIASGAESKGVKAGVLPLLHGQRYGLDLKNTIASGEARRFRSRQPWRPITVANSNFDKPA